MNKQEYLDQLRTALGCLSEEEVEESVAFYTEMIDDRVADGMSEEEAAAQLDEPKTAARAIIGDLPAEAREASQVSRAARATPTQVVPPVQPNSKPKSRVLYWTLVILGSPLWLALLLAGAAVIVAVVAIVAALALSVAAFAASLLLALWVLAAALLAAGPLGVAVCFYGLAIGQPAYAAAELGSDLICFGLGLFCLHGAVAASAGADRLWRACIAKAKIWLAKGKNKIRKGNSETQGPTALALITSSLGVKEAAREA